MSPQEERKLFFFLSSDVMGTEYLKKVDVLFTEFNFFIQHFVLLLTARRRCDVDSVGWVGRTISEWAIES